MHINVSSWEVAWRELLPAAAEPPSEDEIRARCRELLDSSEVELAVAEVGGRVVGLATFGTSRDADATDAVGELRALQVDPAHWRGGVGRSLVAHVLDRLRARGRGEVTLWAFAESDQAADFYAAQGFTREGATQRRTAFASVLEARWRQSLEKT